MASGIEKRARTRSISHTIRRKPEELLKRLLFAAALALTCPPSAAVADDASSLLVGSVRDQTGRPIRAEVVALTQKGRVAGSDRSAADGTFAIALGAAAASLTVSCAHCAPLRVTLRGDEPLALIVTRYLALDQRGPDERDLQALPYPDAGDAAGLGRFVIPIAAGARIASLSDRGLERGRGLVLDEGTPIYDPATGEGALFAYPERALGAIRAIPAARAFTYGSYAGGGAFALDRFEESPTTNAVYDNAGPSMALALAGRFGGLLPALARSRDDDGVERRRADLGWTSAFAGGTLRADAGLAAQHPDDLAIAEDRSRELAGFSYATAARRSRTFLGGSAYLDRGNFLLRPGGAVWGSRSSSLEADARVEHPAPIELDFGGSLRSAGGMFSVGSTARAAHYTSTLGYLEASHSGAVSYDAGIAISRLSIAPGNYGGQSATSTALLPAASLAAELGGGFGIRLGGSTSLRAPTLLELPMASETEAYSLERGNLLEATLSYDDSRRFGVETTAYRQQLTGLGGRTLSGVGFGLAWQVAPRLSVRAWTLHDASNENGTNLLLAPYSVLTGPSLERDVVWASYEARGGLRADAILHHGTLPGSIGTNLDADVLIPLAPALGLAIGSAQRSTVRRSYLGLRVHGS